MLFASLKNAGSTFHHENVEVDDEMADKSCTAIYFDQIRHISSLSRRAA